MILNSNGNGRYRKQAYIKSINHSKTKASKSPQTKRNSRDKGHVNSKFIHLLKKNYFSSLNRCAKLGMTKVFSHNKKSKYHKLVKTLHTEITNDSGSIDKQFKKEWKKAKASSLLKKDKLQSKTVDLKRIVQNVQRDKKEIAKDLTDKLKKIDFFARVKNDKGNSKGSFLTKRMKKKVDGSKLFLRHSLLANGTDKENRGKTVKNNNLGKIRAKPYQLLKELNIRNCCDFNSKKVSLTNLAQNVGSYSINLTNKGSSVSVTGTGTDQNLTISNTSLILDDIKIVMNNNEINLNKKITKSKFISQKKELNHSLVQHSSFFYFPRDDVKKNSLNHINNGKDSGVRTKQVSSIDFKKPKKFTCVMKKAPWDSYRDFIINKSKPKKKDAPDWMAFIEALLMCDKIDNKINAGYYENVLGELDYLLTLNKSPERRLLYFLELELRNQKQSRVSVFSLFLLPKIVETPFILNKQKNKKKLFDVLNYINNINHEGEKREETHLKLKQIQSTMEEETSSDINNSQKSLFKGLFKLQSIKDIAKITVTQLLCDCVYMVFNIDKQNLGTSNVNINMFNYSLFPFLIMLILAGYATKIKRRTFIIMFSVMMIIIPIILLLFFKRTVEEKSLLRLFIEIPLFIIVYTVNSSSVNLLTLIANEILPTEIRGFACGLASYISMVIGSCVPQLIKYCIDHELNSMGFVFIFAIPSLIAALTLEETRDRKMLN